MVELTYRLGFNTPAFLGNAEQAAQWRTPPIKALLRQWWRVAYAADQPQGVDVEAMRRAEGQLFGEAADSDGDSRRSRVRLRLSRWDTGKLTDWSGLDASRITHPEVPAPVGAHLYLGFGPLVYDRATRQTGLKAGAAIQAKEEARLALAFPADAEAPRLRRALWLMHHYGTLGGRSRNGWGSFSLTPADAQTPAWAPDLEQELILPWRDALTDDWPQALGADGKGPLIWQTDAVADWQTAMLRLAKIKIGLRTQQAFKFPHERPDGQVHDRHWLSYPVTKHEVYAWKKDGLRLPNSLRFKVRAEAGGRLRGVIFHVPCRPPAAFRSDRKALEQVWHQVHRFLDGADHLQRIPA